MPQSQKHKIPAWWGLSLWKSSSPTFPAKAGLPTAGCPGSECPGELGIFPVKEIPGLQGSITLRNNQIFKEYTKTKQSFLELQSQLATASHANMASAWPETQPEHALPQGPLPAVSVTILSPHLGTSYLHQLALPVIQIPPITHEPRAVTTFLPFLSFPRRAQLSHSIKVSAFYPIFQLG